MPTERLLDVRTKVIGKKCPSRKESIFGARQPKSLANFSYKNVHKRQFVRPNGPKISSHVSIRTNYANSGHGQNYNAGLYKFSDN